MKGLRAGLGGILLAAALLAACSGSGGRDATGGITFLVFGEPAELEAFRDVAVAFERRDSDGDDDD